MSLFLNYSSVPMIVYRLHDFRIMMVNDPAIKTYGYTNEEFLKLSFLDLFSETKEEKKRVQDHFIDMHTGKGENSSSSIYCNHKLNNGKIINVDITSHGFEKEGVSYRLATIIDITQDQENQKTIIKLNRTNQLLSQVNKLIARKPSKNQLLNEVIKLCESVGEFNLTWFTNLNDEKTTMTVFASSGDVSLDISNKSFSFQESLIKEASCATAITSNKPIVINDLSTTKIYVIGLEVLIEKGLRSLANIPITIFGKPYGIMGFSSKQTGYFDEEEIDLLVDMCNDISFALESMAKDVEIENTSKELSESEIKYHSFFENNIAANYLCDYDGKILDCNNQFLNIFGFKDKEEAKSTNILSLYHDKSERETFMRLIEKLGKLETIEHSFCKRDGSIIYCLLNIKGIFDNNKLVMAQGFAMDITKIKEAELEIIKAHEITEQSNNLKDIFLANISHEIRTPLNAIVGFSGIIRDSLENYLDQEIRDCFDIIDEASARLTRTVNLIITISKLQSKLVKLNLVEINFEEILNELVNKAAHSIKKKNVAIHYVNYSSITTIKSDNSCFTQIFENLLDNAVKYTQEGTVAVLCTTTQEGDLSIQIRDTGIGMTKEYMSNLFRPFMQEEMTFSRNYEGAGLGLSVVKHFIDLIGYTIDVQSKKGEGSCFTVIIPIEK